MVTHAIDTGDHLPIKQPPRRTPFAPLQHVEEMAWKMEEQGIIQPRDKSLVYLNDVLVVGHTVSEHLANLRSVLQRLRETGHI